MKVTMLLMPEGDFKNAAKESADYREFFDKAATKKYTDSRLRRAALYTLLGVTEEMVKSRPEVTLLLGANAKGREYLSKIRKTSEITIITKPADDKGLSTIGKAQLETVRRADELYSMCLKERVTYGEFIKRHPVILED